MNTLALGLGNLAGPDLLIILSIVLILFGAKKLPDLARSMGQSMNEFRKARTGFAELRIFAKRDRLVNQSKTGSSQLADYQAFPYSVYNLGGHSS
jgi:sec-independent protein translocase protein TatA